MNDLTTHPLNDGIYHINIYSKGRTWLGRNLSNFARYPIKIPPYGKFESIEGFWFWLGTGKKHDILKDLYGYKAKSIGGSFPKVHIEGFNEEIKRAIQIKILNWSELKESLSLNGLPLKHYYWYGNIDNPKIYNLPQYQWMVDYIEHLSKKLKT